MRSGRATRRWFSRVGRLWLVAGVALAFVASVVTVNAVTGLSGLSGLVGTAGDRVEMAVVELAAMDRHAASKGVKLADPGEPAPSVEPEQGASPVGANKTTSSVFDGLSARLVGQTNAVNGADTAAGPDVVYQLDADGIPVGLAQTGTGGAGDGKSFLDSDGHGNVTTQITGAGVVGCVAVYDPFGEPVDPDPDSDVCAAGSLKASTGNAAWYRGQTRDGSTGRYQLGVRTYDPATGTFTTPDSFRVSDTDTDVSVGVDPLTANTYAYVNGNPVNAWDPDGHRQINTGGGGGINPAVVAEHKVKRAKKALVEHQEQVARAQEQVSSRFDWGGAIRTVGMEVSGLADVQRCFVGHSKMACAETFGGLAIAGVFKSVKIAKSTARVAAMVERFNTATAAARRTLATAAEETKRLKASIGQLTKQISHGARTQTHKLTDTTKTRLARNEHGSSSLPNPRRNVNKQPAANGVRLSAGEGLERAPGALVRNVGPHENMGALCDELCSLTYASGREHALVNTSSGFQIHAGGATGIDLSSDVTQVLAHTHPYHLPALGPSADDVAMLSQLGQSTSILLEHGQTILFGRGGTIAWR